MKKLILIAFLSCAFVYPALAKDWKTIRVAVEGAYPPFSETKPDGSVVGFDIDIANALCKTVKAKCKLIVQDWDGMIPGLLARKYDAIIASMSITDERKKKVDFTNKYYSAPARFVTKKGSNTSVLNSDLKGLKVGVQRATIMDKFVTDNFARFNILNVKRYNNQDEANLDLISGRVDLGFMEFGTAEAFISSDQGKDFTMIGPSYADEKWFGEGIGIAIRKRDKDLTNLLNEAIKTIRANGVYDQIRGRYFSYDIYGE